MVPERMLGDHDAALEVERLKKFAAADLEAED